MDVIADVGAILHNMQAAGGAGTLTFPYVSWGRHHEQPVPFITIQAPSHPTEPGNIGGGVDLETQELQAHLIWGDLDAITDMDVFRRTAVAEAKRLIRLNARSVSPTWWLQVRNEVNLDEPLNPDSEGPLVMKYDVAIIIHAHAVETYTMN